MRSRARLLTIVIALALNASVLLTWTQQWFSVAFTTGGGGSNYTIGNVTVSGQVAAGALSALALAGLALVGALTIAGPVFRVILGVLQAALGACVMLSAAVALGDPVGASASVITTQTGISGRQSIDRLVTSVGVSGWPIVTIALGVLLVLAGLIIAITGRLWPGSSAKYRIARFEPANPATNARDAAIDEWDALSGGLDPTGAEPNGREPNGIDPGNEK